MKLQNVVSMMTQIEWKTLETADHKPDMIPVWIQELTSSEEAVQKNACCNLSDSLAYEWSAYEALGYAVPFIIDLLRCEDVANKKSIFVLLIYLVGARDVQDEDKHLERFLQEKSLFKSFLYDPDLEVQNLAAGLLSLLVDETTDTGDWIVERLQGEPDQNVRSFYISTLGEWLKMNPLGQRAYKEIFRQLAHEILHSSIAANEKRAIARWVYRVFQNNTDPYIMSFLSKKDIDLINRMVSNQRPRDNEV